MPQRRACRDIKPCDLPPEEKKDQQKETSRGLRRIGEIRG
jgi:hypothetical protein